MAELIPQPDSNRIRLGSDSGVFVEGHKPLDSSITQVRQSPLAEGEIPLSARPILVQRGNPFEANTEQQLSELPTDGTAAKNRALSLQQQTGIIHVHRAPVAGPRQNLARVQGPRPAAPVQAAPVQAEEKTAAYVPTHHDAQRSAPVPAAPARRPMKKVIMSGGGFPARITAVYPDVIISETLVLLGCIDDGESSIVEPPITVDNVPPLNLNIDGHDYGCLCSDFKFQQGLMTYFVLLRTPDEV